MRIVNFPSIVESAWKAFEGKKQIATVEDISARVSTNHVFKVTFTNGQYVIAKVSYFGNYDNFVEDHSIINTMANNLLYPFENFIAKSLVKDNKVFTYRYKEDYLDVWVVFYNPIRTDKKLPRRLEPSHIKKLGEEVGKFHMACSDISNELPRITKTLHSDIDELLMILNSDEGYYQFKVYEDVIKDQCELFLKNIEALGYNEFEKIPVFVDWNIGNFSVTKKTELFSRWDYDWFRVSSRVMDFYFFSRVVSDVGDRTVFSYVISTLLEDRFMLFLKHYHQVYPLEEREVRFIKEAYRFFILNYVVKYGRYFFHEIYANKLQKEAFEDYLPSLESFDIDKILKELKI